MFFQSVISLLVIGFIGLLGMLFGEYLRRRRVIKNEEARKIVHVLHTTAVVVWAYFLPSYWPIVAVELLAIVLVLVEKKLNILPGLRAVGRLSHGEVSLLVGIIVLALLNPSYSHFVVVMLHVAIADAIAAVVGKRVKSPQYSLIASHTKSLAGSLACFAASQLIFVSYLAYFGQVTALKMLTVILGSLLVTFIENVSPYGSDNFTILLTTYLFLLATGI